MATDTHVLVGTELRDAAVDPHPEDFPGVPGAGAGADPHGPTVRCIEVGSEKWALAVDALYARRALEEQT